MKKFTIFTLILTIIIIVVVSEIIVNEYLPNLEGEDIVNSELNLPKNLDLTKTIQTNVSGLELNNKLGADDGAKTVEPADVQIIDQSVGTSAIQPAGTPLVSIPSKISDLTLSNLTDSNPSGLPDFEDENFIAYSTNVYLRDEQIKSAGFVGAYLESEAYNNSIFKTIFTGDLLDTEINKSVIRTDAELLVKVYILKPGINTGAHEIYELLKMRASEGLDIEINETNQFGSFSFYMNDSRRPDTTFLVARIGGLVYAFSYPKEYHSQVKNLIQLIEWELG